MEIAGDKYKKSEIIARDILTQTKSSLMVVLRLMDIAINKLEPVKDIGGTISTDGKKYYYNIPYILKRYKYSREETNRDYLHIILHCIFYHPFHKYNYNKDKRIWSISCDIAVENIINDMEMYMTKSEKESAQKEYLSELFSGVSPITADKVYRHIKDNKYELEIIKNLEDAFIRDDHDKWYKDAQELNGKEALVLKSGELIQSGYDLGNLTLETEVINDWVKISEIVKVNLETMYKEAGSAAGSMLQNLKSVNREKYDYKRFLDKFAVMGEVYQIDEDEFDYIYYTYGLSLFGNMPLIESLEYKEMRKIKEFVIAIDTSGSCSGDIVQKFMQKTYNILMQTESFFHKINLHVIQCDYIIQEVVKITSKKEFEIYMDNMTIKGLGGTDFRPAFQYIDSMIENKEFTNLKGMIYFTDGYGTFPTNKPDYEVVFVFLNSENMPNIPLWSMSLILEDEDIENL